MVLRLTPRQQPLVETDHHTLERVVKSLFQFRRKFIRRGARYYVVLVSVPDPHVTPARKRVWYLTSAFLVVLSQHVNVSCVIRPDNHVIE